MSAPVVTVTASTADAEPAAPPHRISRHPLKNDVDVDYSIAFTGKLGFLQLRRDGTNRANGVRLMSKGAVCGMGIRVGPDTQILGAEDSPQEDSLTLSNFDEGLDEGVYRVGVDALSEDGWSSTD